MQLRTRRRLQLLLVAAIFAAPVVVGLILFLAGWMPGTKSYGLPIRPQRSVADVQIALAGGKVFVWRDRAFQWTLIALPGPDCRQRCMGALDLMHRARITLNQNAPQLRLLYLGVPPQDDGATELLRAWQIGGDAQGKLDDLRPRGRDTLAAALVMPDGVALTYYPDGFDADGLRKDLQKVIR